MHLDAPLVLVSTLLLLAFAVLSVIDGVYLHLWKYRLYAHAASYREHLWHTARAVLFAPIVVLVFAAPTTGLVLFVGVGLIVIDQAIEVLDVLDERDSRAALGGLSSGESALHVVLVTLRTGAIALALASRPGDAWSLASPPSVGAYPDWIELLVSGLVPGALAAALVHLWLAMRYRPAAHSLDVPAST